MGISNASKEAIAGFVIGNNDELWKKRTGRELVYLFQSLGFRDDVYNDRLPKLGNTNANTSKNQYTKDRLLKITDINIIRKLLDQLIQESLDKNKAIEAINNILISDNIHLRYNNEDVFLEGIEIETKIANDASFRENEEKVINAINNARVSILVAMAWFTNTKIKNALDRKREEGLRIELVIYKDGVNKANGVDLSKFDHVEIRGTRGGYMHNKFCVIDNQKVLTGSYNWTTNAEYKNDENVFITNDNTIASEYSVEFRRLKPLITKNLE